MMRALSLHGDVRSPRRGGPVVQAQVRMQMRARQAMGKGNGRASPTAELRRGARYLRTDHDTGGLLVRS